jgi:plasmid stability protein
MERPMAQFLIRDLDKKLVDRLKNRAKASGRSLEAEVRTILENASKQMTMSEAIQWGKRLEAKIKSGKF